MLIPSVKLGGQAAADFLACWIYEKVNEAGLALEDVNSESQGLIRQSHFMQSISEGYLFPLLLNFYPPTSEPRTVFTPRLFRALEELPLNSKKSSLEHQCSWLKEPALGRKAKWLEVQLYRGNPSLQGFYCRHKARVCKPNYWTAQSSQPTCSKAVTHLASVAQ